MADPLSIAGLIVGLSDLIDKLYHYGKRVKNAKADIALLCSELSALQNVLEHVKKRAQELEGGSDDKDFAETVTSKQFVSVTQDAHHFVSKLFEDLGAPRNAFHRATQLMKWPFTKKDLEERLQWLRRANSWYTLAMLADQSAGFDRLFEELHGFREVIIQDQSARRLQEEQRAEGEAIGQVLQALSSVDLETLHEQTRVDWLPETGMWFLDGEFEEWLQNRKSVKRLLWLQGQSGAGKTTLFSQAVETAKALVDRDPGVAVAYFYCIAADAKSHTAHNILSSWVTQLSGTIPTFSQRFIDYVKKRKPIPEEVLIKAIRDAATGKGHLFLFLDAVNESSKADDVLTTLGQVVLNCDNISLLVTCTPEITPVPGFIKVPMQLAGSKHDIEQYIPWRIHSSNLLRSLSGGLQEEIKTVLNQQANGMFRWAQCQLDDLSAQRSGRAVRQRLHQLPGDLNKTYAAMLLRTAPNDRSLVREVLLWLCFSMTPLTMDELREAVAIEYDMKTMDSDDRLSEHVDLVRLCNGLAVLNESTGVVTLGHDSVRRFLTSTHIQDTEAKEFAIESVNAHNLIARKCLTYFTFDDFSIGYCTDAEYDGRLSRGFKLLDYAVYWMDHVRAGSALEADTQMAIRNFFLTYKEPGGGHFGFWLRHLYKGDEVHRESIVGSQPLYYAASFGLTDVVRSLLDSGLVQANAQGDVMDIDAKGGRYSSTALQVACYRGHKDVTEILLQHGANPESEDDDGNTCLFWAVQRRHPDIASLLLRYGANPTTADMRKPLVHNVQRAQAYHSNRHEAAHTRKIG